MLKILQRENLDPFETALENLTEVLGNNTAQVEHLEDLLEFQSHTLPKKDTLIDSMERERFLDNIDKDLISLEAEALYNEYSSEELNSLGILDFKDLMEI